MRLVVAAMHRSGINAIGRWLLRQSSLKSKPLHPLWEDWVEDYNDMGDLTHMFISQINHPDHKDFHKMYGGVGNVVMTIERESTEQVEQFIRDNHLHWSMISSSPTRPWKHVYIIRDFKNWVASVAKSHLKALEANPNDPIIRMYNIHQDIAKYRTYLDRLQTIECFCDDISAYTISYNKWVSSAEYRKDICYDLDLKYTNCGFRDVPQNCGGSSFDGLEFDGRANEMDVLNRWKEYENDAGFNRILDRYSDIVEMSDRFCGVLE